MQLTTLPVDIEETLLDTKTFEKLTSIAEELAHARITNQIFRTETEARISVLDDIHFPTNAAKYWQCVREQMVMLNELANLSFMYRRNEVQIKRLEKKKKTVKGLDAEDVQIDLDECFFKRLDMKRVAEDRAREVMLWSKLKAEHDDGSFDTVDVDKHQLVSYTTQFALRAANVDPSTMSEGEFTNLSGQLDTALKRCKEVGVFDQVMARLPAPMVKALLGNG